MKKLYLLLVLPAFLFLAGCAKENTVEPNAVQNDFLSKQDVSKDVFGILQDVKAATAKYHDIKKALADGYVDINVVVPHMGHHFLNPAYLDGTFDPTHPEILVYELTDNGNYKLVAVEYGVPLSYPVPEGFPGSSDVWEPNQGAGIWTLHAWIWKKNPDGVFTAFNPDVP